jgi:hypothetical protein
MNRLRRLLFACGISLALGAAVALVSPGNFWFGWLVSSGILLPCLYVLFSAWNWGGGGKLLGWMMAAAFLLRLIIGIAVSEALPVYGYGTEVQWHGYLFRDSHERDIAAWNLAQSDAPLATSFSDEIKVDQYGGLLSLSAAIYRYLSPDAHRAYLILILAAFASAVGIPFLIKGVTGRWNRRLANLAAWVVILYPDGVFFDSSQMREPFMLGLSLIAFWAVLNRAGRWKTRLAVFLASLGGMLLFSSRMAVAIAGFLLVWFIVEELLPAWRGPKWLIWGGILLGAALIGALSLGWVVESASLDFYTTEAGSGWVQKIVATLGETFRVPFITAYGLAQPVLPAAIAEPTIPLWRMIMVPRALGWYILAPAFLYALFSVFKAQPREDRRIWLWTGAFLLVWLLLSSYRAGGDQWDNPRYRAAFLPWFALLGSWAVLRAIDQRDAWLVRWLLVEVIFLGFFTNWYFSRYYQWWGRLDFGHMVAWIFGLSALVLSSGLWWPRLAKLLRK